jgi:hypothetical protein
MNRSRAHLAPAFLALTVLGLGATACTQGASTQPPNAGLPGTTSPAAAAPASSPTVPTTTTVSGPKASVGITQSPCAPQQGWGTRPEVGSAAMSPSPLYLTRVGRHVCYDRVVFDLNGPEAVGFVVRYVPIVRTDSSGEPVPVAGHAVLEVVVRAPIFGDDNQGHQPWVTAPTVGENLVAPAEISGWRSLRAVTLPARSKVRPPSPSVSARGAHSGCG